MKDEVQLDQMWREMLNAIRLAEKLAYAYFCGCPVGEKRTRAHEVYEKIRNSTRV
jgi:hypothetical protein